MRISLALAAILALAGRARAEECMTVAEFNSFMETQISPASSVTLAFTVTGVDLADYSNGKGWLAELVDTGCAGLASAALKVYGDSDPLNTAHPPGTVKLEYGSACCASPGCPIEYWADPNPGPAIFTGPAQVCTVALRVDPAVVSYDIQCDGGTTYHGEGANHDAMPVTRVALLSELSGGHAMPNATATGDQVCFELAAPPADALVIPVAEDVTVASGSASSVYPVPADLACGQDDGWIYLKFDLGALPGHAARATLFLHSAADASAAGDGADVFAVADDSWAEASLTWDARPATGGAALARISGVTPDRWYSADVSAGVGDPAVVSLALVPGPADGNGAHFLSKEASATLRPYLLVEVSPADDGGGEDDPIGDPAAPDAGPGPGPGPGVDPGDDPGIDPGGATGDVSGSGCSASARDDALSRAWLWAALAVLLALVLRGRRR